MAKVTKAQIEEWKANYGEIFELEVSGKKGYVRKPGRKQLSYASTVSNSNGVIDSIAFAEHILDACWLGGDEELKTNDDYFLAVVPTLEQLTERAEASIKKL